MAKPRKDPSIYVKDKNRKQRKKSKRKSNKEAGKTDIISWIEDFCQEYLVNQAPELPQNIIDWVVKAIPYLNILGIVILILRLFAPFALVSVVSFLVPVVSLIFPLLLLYYLVTLVNILLMSLAAKGLFKKYQGAWRLGFYLILFNILIGLLSMNIFGIFRTVILGLIGLYVWFQIRDEFDK